MRRRRERLLLVSYDARFVARRSGFAQRLQYLPIDSLLTTSLRTASITACPQLDESQQRSTIYSQPASQPNQQLSRRARWQPKH